GEIRAHMGDLIEWALWIARGAARRGVSEPPPWPQEVGRFCASLRTFDEFVAGPAPLGAPADKLFQGPIADALTHTGQLALLRRLANAPIRGESYVEADIAAGRVGPEQSPPRREF